MHHFWSVMLSIFLVLFSTPAFAESFSDGDFDSYEPDLTMGERLFNAAACGSCHQSKDAEYEAERPTLGGGIEIENSTYGTVRVPNISGHENGIGNWSRSRFLNAMIYGVSEEGGDYIPLHPYEFYAGMRPEHALDIFEYIKSSLPEDSRRSEPNSIRLRLFRLGTNPNRYSFDPEEVMTARETARLGEDPTDSAAWGEYLVEHVSACGACHTQRSTYSFTLEPDQQFQAGHSALGANEIIQLQIPDGGSVADILPSRNDFQYQFIGRSLTTDGRIMEGSMARVTGSLGLLPTEDIGAIHQYLKDLPAPEAFEVSDTCDAPSAPIGFSDPAGEDLTRRVDDWLQQECKTCHVRGAV